MLAGFDVSSLFTNIPINEAVQVIQVKLEQDDTLTNRTTLSPNKVAELLKVCLRSTHFSYGGDFYKQRVGTAMGSPVSAAAVANLYMEYFEGCTLSQARLTVHVPHIWKRYVDNTFCILKKGAVEELLGHLNSLRPAILFPVEVERDGSLPLLDTLLQRKEDGSLSITVYRKPMHTVCYLDFQSHHPRHVKRGLVRCLYDRTKINSNSQDNLAQEEHHITTVLKQNGYPDAFICSSTWPQPTRDADDREVEQEGNDMQRPPVVLLPYVSGVSEDMRRVCKGFGLRVILKSRRSL